jgi:hypothetical protein
MPGRGAPSAAILCLIIAIMFIPTLNALYIVYENLNLARRATANQMAMDTAAGFAIAQDISDRRVAEAIEDVWDAFGGESRDIAEWPRIFSDISSAENIYRDILLAAADGRVVASGRADSPPDAAHLLSSAGGIPSRIYRGEAFIWQPGGECLMPYLGGVGRDRSGNPQYAMIFLVNMDIYQSASAAADIPNGIELCLTDRAGRVIFRHPQMSAAGGAGRGERLPFETWREILNGPARNFLPTVTSNRTRYYSAYSKLADENGDMYGTVIVSLSGNEISPMTNLRIESGAAILLIALLSACLAYVVGLKFASFRRSGDPQKTRPGTGTPSL